jgi:hypothetical protein
MTEMDANNPQNETWGTYTGQIKGFRFENSETKRLGAPIGGSGQQDATRDHDGDGVINDGTENEKPAPKKGPTGNPPKVRREELKLPRKLMPPKPTPSSPYKPGYILPDDSGNWQGYDGAPPKNKPHFREHRDGSIYEIRPNRPPKKVGVGPNEII